MLVFFYIVAVFALLTHIAAAISTWLMLKRKPRRAVETPFVSILKPMRGLDDQLEKNLISFFELDYPNFELILCSAEADDPSLEVARRLIKQYPDVASTLVIGAADIGLNPKVKVLANATPHARGELLLVSDSNVRVRPEYLSETVVELEDPSVAVVSNLVAGVEEKTVGATLENLQLNGFIEPAICLGIALRIPPCVVGKSMLIRRSDLQASGGWESLGGVLAEDFVLGRRLSDRGRRAVICPHVVETVNERWSFGRFTERHDRWLKMRWRINAVALFFELAANVTLWSLLAVLASGFSSWALLASGLMIAARCGLDVFTAKLLRPSGSFSLPRALFVPLRDLCLAAFWIHARFSRSIRWREGQRLIIGEHSKLSLPPSEAPAEASPALSISESTHDPALSSAIRR